MRILFLGTAEFAVPSLDALAACGRHEVIAVVTQPDRPQGRGQKLSASPVKLAALRHGLPLLQPRRVRSAEFLQTARDLAPDALALAAFGQIIPQPLLDLPPYGPINLHGSLLPAYRGAAPIQYAILNGERKTGNTTMWMDATLDTGDILLQQTVDIDDEETTGTLVPKMAEAGAQLLIQTLDLLAEGRCPRAPQDHALANYAPPITPEDSRVPWADPAERIRNRIRALSPRPGVFAEIQGRRVKLWSARAGDGTGVPGEVVRVGKDAVAAGTGGGLLLLTEVQQEGSRRMPAADWARGARITPGLQFTTGDAA